MSPGIVPIGLLVGAGSQLARGAGRFGEMLRAAVAGPPTATSSTATTASADPSELAQAIEGLTARIRGLLEGEGIAPSPPITISQDAFDRLVVSGNHPERQRIESALASSPELADEFRRIATELMERESDSSAIDLPPAYLVDGKPTFQLTVQHVGREFEA